MKEYEFTLVLTADPNEEQADKMYGPVNFSHWFGAGLTWLDGDRGPLPPGGWRGSAAG